MQNSSLTKIGVAGTIPRDDTTSRDTVAQTRTCSRNAQTASIRENTFTLNEEGKRETENNQDHHTTNITQTMKLLIILKRLEKKIRECKIKQSLHIGVVSLVWNQTKDQPRPYSTNRLAFTTTKSHYL